MIAGAACSCAYPNQEARIEYVLAQFAAMFPAIAEKTDVGLIPFFLDNVGGHSDWNQADGIHPIKEGVKIVVENVLMELQDLLVRD